MIFPFFKKEPSAKLQLALVVALSSLFVFFFYHTIIFNLNDSLFCVSGDGLKNYFHYLYHIKHNASYFTLMEMNYPYGESIFLVDCHPLLATLLKFISHNLVDISDYSLGILNFLMLFSLVVASVFLHLICKHYRFSWFIAICCGIAIAFLTSNALLMVKGGHYALTYGCAFPIGWYLLLRYESASNKLYYSLLICLNSFFWFYTYTYLGLILVGFSFFHHVYAYFFENKKNNSARFSAIIIQTVVPLLIVYLVVKLTDTHHGRIDLPFIYHYRASFYSVFLPNHSYLKPLYEIFIDFSPQEKQPWSQIGNYIGLATNITLIAIFITLIYKLIRHRKWIGSTLLSKQDFSMLFSAITLLLFAMAFPFQYELDFLLPTPLKQFIALGRFAWPFYFLIIVLSLKALKNMLAPNWFTVCALLTSGFILTEGFSNHLFIKEKITQHKNLLTDIAYKKLVAQHDFSSYQAMLTIPFYHHYLSLHSYAFSDHAEQLSMALSYQTGKPLLNAILSRPSVLESKSILQLFTASFNQKPVLQKFNDQPIILVVSLKDPHTKQEQALIEKSILIKSTENFEIYELPMHVLSDNKTRSHVDTFLTNRPTYLLDKPSGYFYRNTPPLFYDSFDNHKNQKSYRGKGSKAMLKNQLNSIYQSDSLKLKNNTSYNLSFWYYNHLYDQTFNTIRLELKDTNNKIYHSVVIDPCKSNFYDGNWAYNEINFVIENSSDYLGLYSQGGTKFADSVFIDELLIRKATENYYRITSTRGDTVIIKNNYTIPLR